jgi:asparagine synthase (glutamine-hydrolysing)
VGGRSDPDGDLRAAVRGLLLGHPDREARSMLGGPGAEPKQVLEGAGLRREPDMHHLASLLFEGYSESTALRGVSRIPRGHVATGGAALGPTSTGYWHPERSLETDRRSFDEAAEGLWHHLERACRRALCGADVLQLSGGLDSTAIAGCIAGQAGVSAITTIYPEHPSVDESTWSRMVADHLGLELHAFASQVGGLDDLERWLALADGPVELVTIPEVVESYRCAASVGGRTVLDGQFAELILCTDVYVFDHVLAHGRGRALARLIREHRAAGHPWSPVRRAFVRSVTPTAIHRYRHRRRAAAGTVDIGPVPAWMDRRRMLGDGADDLLPPHAEYGPRHRWSGLQVRSLQGPAAGFEMDDMLAAACGVEVRRPFADPELWEYVLSLRAEVRYADGRTKPLLREAMRGHLPHTVVDRTDKTVFDEAMLASADYPGLRTYLKDPVVDLPGIDYGILAARLEREDLDVKELQWARDLAKIHAFLLTF